MGISTIHLLLSIVLSEQLSPLFANANPERTVVPVLLDVGLLRLNDNLAHHSLQGRGTRSPINHSLPHKYRTRDACSYSAIRQGRDYKELQVPYYSCDSHVSYYMRGDWKSIKNTIDNLAAENQDGR